MFEPATSHIEEALTKLNEPQKLGATTTEGPVLVVAGAGSGKTSMLTTRIAYLIEVLNVPAHNILAVTFTNKAAGEMRERVAHILNIPDNAWQAIPFWAENTGFARSYRQPPTIGTFHSVCIRILRKEIDRLPFTGQFNVLDDSDQLSMVKDCFNKLNLNDKMFSPKSFQYAINEAKCNAQDPHELEVSEYDIQAKNLQKIYEMYQAEMFKSNSIDFGEIITLTYKLFRDHPDVLEKYQEQYRYIHVDEYQDTNRAQYLIVNLLAAKYRNLCVVGDEDQSIYKWRGADVRNILDFEKDYPESQIIKLEQNYRSTKTIISASSHLIANNTTRKEKTLWTENEEGSKIQRIQLPDDLKEAEFVVKMIKYHCEQGAAYKDISIFYRTNAQSRIFEDVLRREKVPYNIIGALKFYDRKEIKDVMAYLKILINPEDSVSIKRIINVPQRGIGKTTVEKIEGHQFTKGLTFYQAIPDSITNGVLAGAAAKKVTDFKNQLETLRSLLGSMSLADFYGEMMDRTGYLQELRNEGTQESFARIENLQEFSSIIAEFSNQFIQMTGLSDATALDSLNAFLESVSLTSAADDKLAVDNPSGIVSLMTLHTSKGLEFPLVFIVGCEEGLFPSIRRGEEPDDEDVEEERRLCYVGMTRARKLLYMTNAVCRRIYGNIMYQEPSRFFQEIPARYLEFRDFAKGMGNRYTTVEESDVPSQLNHYSSSGTGASTSGFVGKRVRHASYGLGIVRSHEGDQTDGKVTVEFQNAGIKKFMLKFAQLEIMS